MYHETRRQKSWLGTGKENVTGPCYHITIGDKHKTASEVIITLPT